MPARTVPISAMSPTMTITAGPALLALLGGGVLAREDASSCFCDAAGPRESEYMADPQSEQNRSSFLRVAPQLVHVILTPRFLTSWKPTSLSLNPERRPRSTAHGEQHVSPDALSFRVASRCTGR